MNDTKYISQNVTPGSSQVAKLATKKAINSATTILAILVHISCIFGTKYDKGSGGSKGGVVQKTADVTLTREMKGAN